MARRDKWLLAGCATLALFLLGGWSIVAGAVNRNRSPAVQAAQLAPDAVKVDPKHYKVELENDRVRVVRITYGPREKSVMHGHPAGLVVFLTDAHYKFTYPDGKSEEITGKKGHFLW